MLNVVYASSTRASGNMSLFYGDTVRALDNRKNFLRGLGIDYRDLVCAKQVHGGAVRRIRESDSGRGALTKDNSIPDTDAFITDNKNLPLAMFTADCLPVFLHDPKTPAIGLVHAGWRSSREEITAKSVQLMREEFGTRAEDLCACLGPAIRDCCYEVAEEFSGFFTPEHVIQRESRYYLDLAGVNKKQLLSAGVKEENILDHRICTVCRSEEFFSYRKEGNGCGRIVSVIMLK